MRGRRARVRFLHRRWQIEAFLPHVLVPVQRVQRADERTRTADLISLRVSERAFTAIPDCTEIGIDPQLVRHTCTPTSIVVETSCRQDCRQCRAQD